MLAPPAASPLQQMRALMELPSLTFVSADAQQREAAAAYDPWEEVGNMRQNFWSRSFASRRFKGVIGEEKLKARLAELEKKREAEKMRGEG